MKKLLLSIAVVGIIATITLLFHESLAVLAIASIVTLILTLVF